MLGRATCGVDRSAGSAARLPERYRQVARDRSFGVQAARNRSGLPPASPAFSKGTSFSPPSPIPAPNVRKLGVEPPVSWVRSAIPSISDADPAHCQPHAVLLVCSWLAAHRRQCRRSSAGRRNPANNSIVSSACGAEQSSHRQRCEERPRATTPRSAPVTSRELSSLSGGPPACSIRHNAARARSHSTRVHGTRQWKADLVDVA